MIRSAITIGEFFERTYVPVVLLGRAQSTIADMRSFVTKWDGVMGPVDIAQIDLPTAANFLRDALRNHFPATCNKYRAYLLALLREAKRHRLTQAKWFKRLRKLPEEKKLPTAWTKDQVEALLRAASQQPGHVCGLPASKFWPTLILLILNTALRIGAAMSIRTADVDLQRGFLVVRASKQKQKAEQFFMLSPRTIEAIQAIWDPDRPMLLPWQANLLTLKRHFAKICKLAGVPAGGHSGYFHRGRCTAVKHAWTISPEYARLLAGHASADTTVAHYVDPRIATPGPPGGVSLF